MKFDLFIPAPHRFETAIKPICCCSVCGFYDCDSMKCMWHGEDYEKYLTYLKEKQV